jgi:hypothetical protein
VRLGPCAWMATGSLRVRVGAVAAGIHWTLCVEHVVVAAIELTLEELPALVQETASWMGAPKAQGLETVYAVHALLRLQDCGLFCSRTARAIGGISLTGGEFRGI